MKKKKTAIKSPLRHHVSPKKLSKKKLNLLNAKNTRITDFYNISDNWRETSLEGNNNLKGKESVVVSETMEKGSNPSEKSTRKYNLRQNSKKKNYFDEECDANSDADEVYVCKFEKSKNKIVKNNENTTKSKENITKNTDKQTKTVKTLKKELERISDNLKNCVGRNNNVFVFQEDEIGSLNLEEHLEPTEGDNKTSNNALNFVKKEKIKSKVKTKLSPSKVIVSASKTKLSPIKNKFSPIKLSPIKPKISPSKSDSYTTSSKVQRKPLAKLNDTFTKYGLILPSYEDLVKDEEELIAYSRKLNQACNVIQQNPIIHISPLKLRPSNPPKLLSCEHLSPKEIKILFMENLPFCLDIINGKSDSERHKDFMKNNVVENNGKFLTYNISMIVFSTDQKQQLAKLCKKHFNDCDIINHAQYYFKVLLPELCLKIFMDQHFMSKEEAIEYLENRPVEDFK